MYDLDKLGWVEFEELVQILLIARLGPGVEAWGRNGDWGRDAFFEGALNYPTTRLSRGPFLFQCKFVENANASGAKPERNLIHAVKRECFRITERQGARKCKLPRHYVFISNAPVRPKVRNEIKRLLADVLPTTKVHIHDGRDVMNWLKLTPEIIPRFPQLFTIRALDEFLADALARDVAGRSEVALTMARRDSKVFVPTGAYFESRVRLEKHSFVVLEGPPEMGKTTIARVIGLSQVTQGWEAIECKKPMEFHKTFKSGRRQVFIADDFFGRTEYEPERISIWQDELPYILERLDSKHWLILTSRAHLLNIAKRNLDVPGQNSRFPKLGEVVVNAGKLSRFEKAKILYRHAKVAKLSVELKDMLKARLTKIVDHDQFTPLRIKNLVSSLCSPG